MAGLNTQKTSEMLVSGAIIFKDARGKRQFLLTNSNDNGGWEFPKVTVRRGESSVRAVLRLTAEQAGMSARILEEAGRFNQTVAVNGKTVNKRTYYYLMVQRAAGEVIGFAQFDWFEYAKATRKLSSKKEQNFLKDSQEIIKTWEKNRKPKSQS